MLPREDLGVRRRDRSKDRQGKGEAETPVVRDPVAEAWSELFHRLRQAGETSESLNALSVLRSAAQTDALHPRGIDLPWLLRIQSTASRSQAAKLHMACRLLNRYAGHEALRDLLPKLPLLLPDRRTTAAGLEPEASNELDRLIALEGVSKSTARAHRIAVRALAEVTGASPNGAAALRDLLSCDPDTVDWAHHAPQAKRYRSAIAALHVIATLTRHDGWLALQEAVVEAGVTARNNPVPYFFGVMDGAPLCALTPAWLRTQERTFRSTLHHPPHGRADLALTLIENAKRLDALHAIPALDKSGHLPPPLLLGM
jgi:hypothetical protein